MSNKQGLGLIIAFQLLILMAMFIKAFYPLWVGESILLKVIARDPRDIFRGNYAVLNYSFNSLDVDSLKTDLDSLEISKLTFGDKLYVEFTQKNNYYEPIGVWQEKPSTNNKVMQVVVQYRPYSKLITVNGGIESYFTAKENAMKLESMSSWANQDSVTVEVAVKVADNGAARIAEVQIKEK
jgi:uncharacterized membrane-anchored protein